MKRNPSSNDRGWAKLDLQSRLYLVFSILFGFSVLVVAFFLTSSVRMIALNNHSRQLFERNRQLYQLQVLTQQYEMAMKTFENASGETTVDLAWEQIPALSGRIDDSVAALRPEIQDELLQNVDGFLAKKQQVSAIYDQILEASSDEDWDLVYSLDEQAYQMINPMYADLDAAIALGVDELNAVRTQMDTFNLVTWVIAILSVPMFIFLALVTALVIYRQINQPLEIMAGAAKKVLSNQFDPSELSKLADRKDEVGYMAREFIGMFTTIEQHTARLKQEAVELRAKIR